jgi:probable HAF family extracellular repeat protein
MKLLGAARSRSIMAVVSALATLIVVHGPSALAADPPALGDAGSRAAAPPVYVADFVSTAATGADMNDTGTVTGTSYPDPGCGPFCLPPLQAVVWRAGQRIVLPTVPGFSTITVRSINDMGWVAGFAGVDGLTTHAVVWKPSGNTYQAIDLGTLPGTAVSTAVGIDDLGRVVGWSTTSTFPANGSPFVWTEAGGMVDLSVRGFPDEMPLAISPEGTVATRLTWYRLGDPTSIVSMPPAPNFVIGSEPTAINDEGDQARFLISTGTDHRRYLFRFRHEGTWQQISFSGIKNTPYGVGSIDAAGDVTATSSASA